MEQTLGTPNESTSGPNNKPDMTFCMQVMEQQFERFNMVLASVQDSVVCQEEELRRELRRR